MLSGESFKALTSGPSPGREGLAGWRETSNVCVRPILGSIRGHIKEEVVMNDRAKKSLGP